MQKGEDLSGVQDRKGRAAKSLRVACHDQMAAGSVGRGGSDRILEVLPRGLEGLLQGAAIDGGDTKEFEDGAQRLLCASLAQPPREEIVDSGSGVGGEKAFGFAVFHRGAQSRAGGDMGLTIEEHVEKNAGINEGAFSRVLPDHMFAIGLGVGPFEYAA